MQLVHSMPDFFAHSGTCAVPRGEGFKCECEKCGRDVAAPHEFQGCLIWCLYCGMEHGHVPLLEHPFPHKYTFGVSGAECIEDKRALKNNSFEQMAEDRARRNGHLVDWCI